MKKFLVFVVSAILLASLLTPSILYAQASDPAAVVEAFITAFNAYDAEATSKIVGDDFEMKIIYGGPDDVAIKGKEELAGMLGGVQTDNFQLSVSDLKVDGTHVTGSYSGNGDQIRAVGIGPEIGTVEASVENSLLQSIVFTVDPEYNKRFAEAIAARENLPTTGADASTPVAAALALGLVLLVLGLLVFAKNKM